MSVWVCVCVATVCVCVCVHPFLLPQRRTVPVIPLLLPT